MCCRKMVNIIKGTFRNIFNITTSSSLKRLSICAKCKHRKHLWGFGHYCELCGCIIKSKITVEEEVCPIKKW